MRVLLILLAMTSMAAAKDFNVTDQDQLVVQQICDIAAMSPSPTREVRAQIGAWCVSWERRTQEANKPEPKKSDADK